MAPDCPTKISSIKWQKKYEHGRRTTSVASSLDSGVHIKLCKSLCGLEGDDHLSPVGPSDKVVRVEFTVDIKSAIPRLDVDVRLSRLAPPPAVRPPILVDLLQARVDQCCLNCWSNLTTTERVGINGALISGTLSGHGERSKFVSRGFRVG